MIYLKLQAHVNAIIGSGAKNSSAFLKAATTTLLHTISDSEKSSYVAHINNYLSGDEFLNKYLPINPSSNDLFEVVKDGVLLCKLINVAVPGTIDERAINTKSMLNPWERNENHTLCLNSAKAIGCTVVNIGTQDIIEGRRHLVLGVISQIIKIQLLADLNLKKTPQLVELVDDSKDVEELMSLPPDKILLRWMNFQLRKTEYKKTVTNFSSDVKDAEAYTNLLNVLAPEHKSPSNFDSSMYINNVFEDLRDGWILLQTLDKVSPGIVNWKIASKPPIKLPFKKVENCNQVVKLGKQLKFSLVNIAGNDIVQGNKKLILAYLWQLMRYNILQLLKNLRSHSNGKEITDVDILEWANAKVRKNGSQTRMFSFRDKSLSDGIFFLELLSSVQPRAVNWSLVTNGVTDEEKKMNATYVISIARKMGCSIFLLPEDITEVNQKMILTLTASIMHWTLKEPLQLIKPTGSPDSHNGSGSLLDDSTSDSSLE
ncbi:hypothetical protein F2Q70_00000289 [Brassica cretica]|uniref:Calponin-homology (CH) domain-containing protein n=1 Tax=Brassica cretica TaxID=69181 RepID=A0A8S9IRN7_BRACR|nr:hypothetical protein F2Q70_00000289 [Brassica cretica]